MKNFIKCNKNLMNIEPVHKRHECNNKFFGFRKNGIKILKINF